MKSKKNNKALIVVGLIAIGIFVYYIFQIATVDSFLTIQYYNANGQLIQTALPFRINLNPYGNSTSSIVTFNANPFSIVGGVPGVSSITVTAAIKNTGSIGLNCYIADASPPSFKSATSPSNKVAVGVGETKLITSGKISIAQYEGTDVTFGATVNCDYSYAGQSKTLTKSGTIHIGQVLPDASGSFEVNFVTSTDGSTGGSTGSCLMPGTACVSNSECCTSYSGWTNQNAVCSSNKCCVIDSYCTSTSECCPGKYCACPIGSQKACC